jgi:hypothetical protein
MQERGTSTGFLRRLRDPGYRLNGENPATTSLEHARRWATNYDKLLEFKRELMALIKRRAEASDPDVARAIMDTDILLLETQISRFQQRRDYWHIRSAELAGGRGGGAN